ncbi:hypothetical protein BC332_00833 [Capsicum chinense]|nr:hypothetical protein BC332_00833 [Capsicum chinense]
MLEIEQPNQEEMHVFIKGNILRFSIYEFALKTSLNCFCNVEDFKYDDSSSSRLMRRLMASLRQEFFVEKQLYRLGGIPEVLNVWMFELCSNVDTKVAVKEGPTSTDSPVKETDKSVEMKEDKVNQAPSPFKNGEQHEKDDRIEKLRDIVVEEMQSLNSIISVREHDMTLTIYKPPPTTPDKYITTDYFFKVYIDKAYVNYYNADAGKELATQDASARTDEVVDMEMSLINTIKGLSTHTDQPWHLVNEVFVPINCDGAFDWILTVIVLKDRFRITFSTVTFFSKRNCSVFVAVYAEYLSEELGILFSNIDAQYHRLRYASLLCKYGSEKTENDYFSENDNPQGHGVNSYQKKQAVFCIFSSCLFVG